MNLTLTKNLNQRVKEWEALQFILSVETPNARWHLLQLWLSKHGEWQNLIKNILAESDNDACLKLICDAINLPFALLSIIDPSNEIRESAKKYIAVIRELYKEREGLN